MAGKFLYKRWDAVSKMGFFNGLPEFFFFLTVPSTSRKKHGKKLSIRFLQGFFPGKIQFTTMRVYVISVANFESIYELSLSRNIRELENIIERMIILSGDELISADLLPPQFKGVKTSSHSLSIDIPEQGISIDEVEKDLINKALKKAGGE